jgi:hypothetical protein
LNDATPAGFGRVSVVRRASLVTARNARFQVAYDLTAGVWNYSDDGGNEVVRGVGARWRESDAGERATTAACQRSFRAEPTDSERFGEGARLTFAHRGEDDPIVLEVLVDVYSDVPFAVVTLRICNEGSRPVSVDRMELVHLSGREGAAPGGIFLGGDPNEYLLFLNGSGYLAHGYREVRPGVVFPDQRSEEYVSDGLVFHPRSQRAVVFGFLEAGRWWNGARFGHELEAEEERAPQGISLWRVYQTCDGAECPPNGRLLSDPLYVNVTTPATEAQRHYAATVGRRSGETPSPSASWHLRAEDSQTPLAVRVSALLRALDKQSAAVVGEGALRHVRLGGEWLAEGRPSPIHFPDGIRAVVDEVHAAGLQMSGDVPTYLADEDVDVELRPAVLLSRSQQAASFSAHGFPNALAFDPTHPLTEQRLRACLQRAYGEWGLDGVYTTLAPFRDLAGDDVERFRWHGSDMTRAEISRRAYDLLLRVRDEVAPGGILGLTDVPPGLAFTGSFRSNGGLDHYYRALSASHEGPWGLKALLRAYMARWYGHGHWWELELGPLRFIEGRSRNESQLLATLGVLSGGHLCFADDVSALDADDLNLLARCLPLPGATARPVPIADRGQTFAWAQSVETSFGSWELLALLNFSDLFEETTVQLADLNLSRSKGYLVYEFWDRLFVGTCQRTFSVPTLPPRSARVFVLREETDRPTLLATDFHVSQGKAELLTLGWDDKSESLLGICQGPKRGRGALFFHVPEAYVPVSAACTGAKYSFQWRPPVYELHLALGEEPVPFSIRFARASG